MPNWSDTGHAMRRRSGMPMSHHESVGNAMSKNFMTPEEVIASAEHSNSPRRYVGMAPSVTSAPALQGKLMPKKNTQAADPTIMNKANRKNVPAGSAAQSERLGARYTIGAKFPAVHSIEATATLANSKIVPSIAGRNKPNFDYGTSGTY